MSELAAISDFTCSRAISADAAAIAAVRLAAARDLTARFGSGPWSFTLASQSTVEAELFSSVILLARSESSVLATLRLATQKPWLGDISFFTPCARPIYLTSMAVRPNAQRRGIGRALLGYARTVAREMAGEIIRLDSYDADAGAGDFYRKSGYRTVRRGSYHGTPLLWFELPLGRSEP